MNQNNKTSRLRLVKWDKPFEAYFQEVTVKRQIVLHHTASGRGVEGDIAWWSRKGNHISTPYIIGRDGVVTQVYDPKYWSYHLGVAGKLNKDHILDKSSIGIEIDNWGYLMKTSDGKFTTYSGQEIPNDDVVVLRKMFRGHIYWEKYTEAQIDAVVKLVSYLCSAFNIAPNYHPTEGVLTCYEALHQVPGVYVHCGYRTDKTDIYPYQPFNDALSVALWNHPNNISR